MGVRVLVVDDTPHIRGMLADMLSLDGFEVVGAAADAEQARALAKLADPEVIVMDLRLPQVDGLEAARQIRSERPEQSIVLYTAFLDAEIVAEAHDAGVSLCLTKLEGLPQLSRELERLALHLPS